MKLPRFFEHDHESEPPPASEPAAEHHVVELDTEQIRGLSNVFAAPKWLRDAGSLPGCSPGSRSCSSGSSGFSR